MELEFWRSIKDSDDANDFELYVRQFPQGVYASLAARKAAKLRSGSPADDSGTAPWREPTGRGSRRASPAPKPRRARERRSRRPSSSRRAVAGTRAAGKNRSPLVPAVLGVLVAAAAVTYFVVVKPSQQSADQKVEAEAKARRDAAEAQRPRRKRNAMRRRRCSAMPKRK